MDLINSVFQVTDPIYTLDQSSPTIIDIYAPLTSSTWSLGVENQKYILGAIYVKSITNSNQHVVWNIQLQVSKTPPGICADS